MDTKSTERFLHIRATARVQSYSSYSSEVVIFQNHHVEILLQDKRSGSCLIETLGSYLDPCREGSTLSLDFDNFTPSYIFRRLAKELNDSNLSRYMRDYIFDESQRRDLPQGQPLLITVLVESTRRVYLEREETCAICLDDFESKTMSMFPGCYHQFHRECLCEWIVRRGHDSCPLCRHPVK
ncbi:hypothetical protein F2Q69_00062687 [Brassica cretica]|uniref:RING-type domain-containing protein n=2 Tax=Brassica cretica TaxID=69181 RepID=A0A8S9RDD6_BRACR|nr:hypothetical protein DY000_02057087 [Brassica cretica]KAF3570766.1 hypothetical protein F2Q69_00062687 [Brassica cretica]